MRNYRYRQQAAGASGARREVECVDIFCHVLLKREWQRSQKTSSSSDRYVDGCG